MSASMNLHSTDSNSVTVRNFEDEKTGSGLKSSTVQGFATVSVFDTEKNAEVTLFFANVAEVINFSIMVREGAEKALKASK